MTEDEAFIRAIVDSPGDDTPRLVYADWLDDRADPRGPFLRAETEWAWPWRTGHRPVDDVQMQAIAAQLDPLWVARVSRPPLGVCCDGLAFLHQGRQLTEGDIQDAESSLGVCIVGEYRAFLLNYNGGRPRSRWQKSSFEADEWFYSLGVDSVTEQRRSFEYHVQRYLSLLPSLLSEELWEIRPEARPEDVPWQADVLPVGDTGGDFQLFHAASGQYAGLLHLQDWTNHVCPFGNGSTPPTLPEFLGKLTEYGHTLPDTYPSIPLQGFWQS